MEQPTIQEPGYAAPVSQPWQPNEGLFGLGVGGWKNPFVNATITQETINNKPGYYRRFTKFDGTQGIEEVTDQKEIKKSILGGEIGKPAKDAAEAKAEEQRQKAEREVVNAAARERELRNRQLGIDQSRVDSTDKIGTANVLANVQGHQVTDRGNLLNAGVQLANADVNRLSALSGLLTGQQENKRADELQAYNINRNNFAIYENAMRQLGADQLAARAEKVGALRDAGAALRFAFSGR